MPGKLAVAHVASSLWARLKLRPFSIWSSFPFFSCLLMYIFSIFVNKVLKKKKKESNINCNCNDKTNCPMSGYCNDKSMIYQAEVTTPDTKETYIGLCDTTFKLRYRNHICSFKNEQHRNSTELSKYIWTLKDQKVKYDIKWRKVKQARPYSNINKKCNLCLWEKFYIIYKPLMATLNKRNELISCCRHSKKFLLNAAIPM